MKLKPYRYVPEKLTNTFCSATGTTIKNSPVVILPVPFEGTVSYGKGASLGPAAIIDASRHIELYDREFGCEITSKVNVFTDQALPVARMSAYAMLETVHARYKELALQNKFVVMLGGEHSISSAVDESLRAKYPGYTVLQWDAHTDMRDTWEGTPYSHACVMRRFAETGRRVVHVGSRNISITEDAWFKKHDWYKNIFPPAEFNVKKILDRLSDKVYISIDVDGFDPGMMPSTGTPEPGGLWWRHFIELMREVFKRKTVIGCDITELAPIKGMHAPDFAAAMMAFKFITYKYFLSK